MLLGAVAGLIAVGGSSALVFGAGTTHLLATLARSQSEGDWSSIPGAITNRLHLPAAGHVATWLLATVFLGVTLRLLRNVRRGALDWIDGAAWATLVLLVASSSLLPWYVVWLLPLAALARDERLRTGALVLSGLVLGVQLLGYIPHGLPLV